jgi:hypothetical protein
MAQGMFGPSAEETRLALENEGQAQDIGWSNMTGGQAVIRNAASAGRKLGGAAASAMGYEDPRMAKAKLMEEAKMEVDSSGVSLLDDPKSYYSKAFESLSKRGLTDEAAGVYNLLIESESTQAETEYKRAQAADLGTKALKGRFVQNAKGQVIDSATGEVIQQGSANYEAASAQAKIHQDYLNGQFGEVGTPEARALYEEAMTKANYMRPPTNVDVINTGETAYGKTLGAEAAKQDAATFATAKTASTFLQSAETIEEALDQADVIVGPGADVKLALAKLMNVAGADNDEMIAQTQILASRLAKSTLDAIPSSNLGGGQGFTERDKEFLISASSGSISWTEESLRYLAYLNKKTARNQIVLTNDMIKSKTPKQLEIMSTAGFDTRLKKVPDIGKPPAWNKPSSKKDTGNIPKGVDPEVWSELSPRGRELYRQRKGQ